MYVRSHWSAAAKLWWLPALLVVVGCSSGMDEAEREAIESAVQSGLGAWKNGEPSSTWRHEKAPVRFADSEWLAGYKLLDYQIIRVQKGSSGTEAVVKLSLKRANGPPLEQHAYYTIHNDKPPQVVISRDPMR